MRFFTQVAEKVFRGEPEESRMYENITKSLKYKTIFIVSQWLQYPGITG